MNKFITMTVEQIESRKAEILVEMDKDGADLSALEAEMREANAEIEKRAADEAKKAEIRKMVASSTQKGTAVEPAKVEVRNSQAYIDAYAQYLKSGDDTECRSLLTANATATGTKLPVPEFLQEKIETAWEKNEVLNRVTKTYLRGNIKVPFELTADAAQVHAEGSAAVTEEGLTFGLVELKPETVKKWVSFSDEVEAMKGKEFLDYIYDEVIYRVIKKLADNVLDDIAEAGATNTATAIGVPAVTAAPSITAIPNAVAHLNEDATDLVIIMNRLTEVDFLAAHAAGSFAIDPFAGVTKVYSSHLPAYSAATTGDVYAIVGDLKGMRVNYPEGEGVEMKYDDLTRKKEDIVEVLGRQYAAHGVTKLGHFATLKKA